MISGVLSWLRRLQPPVSIPSDRWIELLGFEVRHILRDCREANSALTHSTGFTGLSEYYSIDYLSSRARKKKLKQHQGGLAILPPAFLEAQEERAI